ncbi:MAG: choice-of-anchor D domain-containing protein, partial [Candidatus Acidiferrales bacterium]
MSGGYEIERDGTVGFRVGRHDAGAELVLDPSISLAYDSFLGGAGDDEANSIALDASGNIYVAGTSTSPATFPETGGSGLGPAGGSPDFFIAKINPALNSLNSLVYLTFVGGSGSQNGGLIAVDAKGDVAMTGTTTSADYPVTDGSKLASGSSGANGAVVTQIDASGAKLLYSTVLSGNGQEATQNGGGIALGSAGEIFIASDTTSTNLCANAATTTPFQAANGGGGVTSDGFLALFNTSMTPALRYCTYLGITAQVGVAGLAVDADGNAFLGGFTSDPGGTFPSTAKGFQTAYAGGDFDGFLIKIAPSGNGAADLSYATYLGGSGADQIAAVTVGAALPATAYVTGVTESADFLVSSPPHNPGYQSIKKGAANAFLAVVTQNSSTGAASLAYYTYLGGTQTDAGLSVAVPAGNALAISNQVYVAGVASSPAPDFPWLDNFQPLNGKQDAFIAKFDPTQSGAASLIYATPLGGTDLTANSVGAPPATSGNGVAADGQGHVYVAGTTSASDFPQAANMQNGLQVTCASCQLTPAAPDAFVAEIAEGTASLASVSFNVAKIGFAAANVGASVPAVNAAVYNSGSAPLVISQMSIAGTNAADFQLTGQGSCTSAPVAPGKFCTFSVGFSPSQVGPETATVVLADNAPVPGSTQVLDAEGRGNGPMAVAAPGSLSFGEVQNGAKATLNLTISNAGNQTLNVSSVSSSNSAFVLQPAQCNTVTAGQYCTEGVTFTPNGTGPFSGVITVTDNSGNVTGSQQLVDVAGTGVSAAPLASATPPALTFSAEDVGTSSAAQTVTLNNAGKVALNISSIGISGAAAGSFGMVTSGNEPCPASGGTVAAGGSCTVEVAFTPQASGTLGAVLEFNDDASNGAMQSVTLTGQGTASTTATLTPPSVAFAAQSVGTTSAAIPVVLANTGNSPLTGIAIAVTPAGSKDFAESSNCGASLGAQSSCTIEVTFSPA